MLQFLKSLFRSLVSRGLAAHNPFAAFRAKKKETKRRVIIPKQDRRRILGYFHKRGMNGYVAMIRLCFRYLVRPKEILMLWGRDIDFDTGLLRIPPEVSKNHTERIVALGCDVMKYFRELPGKDAPRIPTSSPRATGPESASTQRRTCSPPGRG